jgi:hypothetical protein
LSGTKPGCRTDPTTLHNKIILRKIILSHKKNAAHHAKTSIQRFSPVAVDPVHLQ